MEFCYARKAQFYETDAMGVIHHSNYIRWFEEARVDLMEKLGYGYARLNALGIDVAVTAVNCEFRSMTRFGETVHIRLWLAALSPAKMTVRYSVTDAETGVLRVEGETRHGFVGGQTKRPVALKKAVPELYELFARELVSPEACET